MDKVRKCVFLESSLKPVLFCVFCFVFIYMGLCLSIFSNSTAFQGVGGIPGCSCLGLVVVLILILFFWPTHCHTPLPYAAADTPPFPWLHFNSRILKFINTNLFYDFSWKQGKLHWNKGTFWVSWLDIKCFFFFFFFFKCWPS